MKTRNVIIFLLCGGLATCFGLYYRATTTTVNKALLAHGYAIANIKEQHFKDIGDLQDAMLAIEEQHITDVGELIEVIDNLTQTRMKEMIVTGYHPTKRQGGAIGALALPIVTGHTVAVSPKCRDWLGLDVYIDGIGIRTIEDLTSPNMDEKRPEFCTIDVALPTSVPTHTVGAKVRRIVRLN